MDAAADAISRGDRVALLAYADVDTIRMQVAHEMGRKAAEANPLASLFGSMMDERVGVLSRMIVDTLLDSAARGNAKGARFRPFSNLASFVSYGPPKVNGDIALIEALFDCKIGPKKVSKQIGIIWALKRTSDAWRVVRIQNPDAAAACFGG